jgi:methylmalonyl-CoA mutase
MYRGRPWTLRQYAGFSTAEETNSFFKDALSRGQRGLSVAFDLPTHRGYDSDHPRARGDVGKAGVAVDSVEDVITLFNGISLKDVSVSMTMNGAVLPIMAAFIVAAEEQGVPAEQLTGTIQNDILKEFLVRNTYIYPPQPSIRIATDVIAYCAEKLPRFNSVSVSGYHMHEAGASEELELAFTIADGLEYVKCAAERGLDVDHFVPRVSFFFAIGMDFFLEVAKLRAARKLWAVLVKERFNPKKAGTLMLRMHCQTSGVSLTAQQPLNNVVRTTIEALAAVMGGTQSLHTNAYDEALALPSNESARVARDTQLIIQEETDILNVIDPLAGCHLVEDLTEQLFERAKAVIEEVDKAGGMVRAIEGGLAQARIQRSAAERQLKIDKGERPIVGVNCYQGDEAQPLALRFIDDSAVSAAQEKRLEDIRGSRDNGTVQDALSRLGEACRDPSVNLMPAAIECMRLRATLGEVSKVLEDAFGRHQEAFTVTTGVYAQGMQGEQDWEELRSRVKRFESKEGRRPRILIAKIGQDGHDRGAKVVASGFADAGFVVDLGSLFQTPAEVAQNAIDHDVHVIGISSQAGGHRVLVPELMKELAQKQSGSIQVVCGGIIPEDDVELLRNAGVGALFRPGVRIQEAVSQVLALLEEATSS